MNTKILILLAGILGLPACQQTNNGQAEVEDPAPQPAQAPAAPRRAGNPAPPPPRRTAEIPFRTPDPTAELYDEHRRLGGNDAPTVPDEGATISVTPPVVAPDPPAAP